MVYCFSYKRAFLVSVLMKFEDQNPRREFANMTLVIETAAVGKCGWVCTRHRRRRLLERKQAAV